MIDTAAPASIAVIVPTHNRARLLPRALRSILGQSLKPNEIIVVDDGSTDETREMIRRDFSSIHYLHQSQSGVSSARNVGVAFCSSDWVAFLDSDDEWDKDKLAGQWRALQQQPEFNFCHTDEVWIRNGRRVNPMDKHSKTGGWIYPKCLPLCAISPSSVMIRRSVLLKVGGFDETLPACEDYDLWLRLCARYPVLYVPERLINKYGGHEDQLSRRYWGMDRFRIKAMEKMLNSGILSSDNAEATLEMLQKKIAIMLNGSIKREQAKESKLYGAKLEYWSQFALAGDWNIAQGENSLH